MHTYASAWLRGEADPSPNVFAQGHYRYALAGAIHVTPRHDAERAHACARGAPASRTDLGARARRR
eukprot:8115650-Lingulodinium_polyedra.AAC.1